MTRSIWLMAWTGTLCVCAMAMGGSVAALWWMWSDEARDRFALLLSDAWPLLVMVWLLLAAVVAWFWRQFSVRYVSGLLQLIERMALARMATTSDLIAMHPLPRLYQPLLKAVNEVLQDRNQWRSSTDARIAQASLAAQQEHNRLAALMSELAQSVVVCNLDGRIVLYNNRAKLQFRALSTMPSLAGGAEWMGIGRSVYAVLDRSLVAHAIERLQLRLQRGAASPSTEFLTATVTGQWLRIHMAPVTEAHEGSQSEMTGFVLTLENVTQSLEEDAVHAAKSVSMLDDLRATLANTSLTQAREQLERLTAHLASQRKSHSALEEVATGDVLMVLQQRMQKHSPIEVVMLPVSMSVSVRVDSFSLAKMFAYLAIRLNDAFDLKHLQMRATEDDGKLHIDLVWQGLLMSTETVMAWELDPVQVGDVQYPWSVRDVMARHNAALSFHRERVSHQAWLRISLPLVEVAVEPSADVQTSVSRPEFFDFDLFDASGADHALDDCPLSRLAYTVFDTETTGLRPSEGDEIIQIGAVRVIGGKLLRAEAFEQLVDPGRMIPSETIPIHGITQEMVRGQPRITQVLPAFHAYAHETILVAHNAAFDMKFLQLQERATGCKFGQPVLDTLMLSAVIHPHQTSHRLEAIAERMNILIQGRHTALGDAMVTAEVFVRMIPLLAEMGIHTLRQAREAAQKTYYAKLEY